MATSCCLNLEWQWCSRRGREERRNPRNTERGRERERESRNVTTGWCFSSDHWPNFGSGSHSNNLLTAAVGQSDDEPASASFSSFSSKSSAGLETRTTWASRVIAEEHFTEVRRPAVSSLLPDERSPVENRLGLFFRCQWDEPWRRRTAAPSHCPMLHDRILAIASDLLLLFKLEVAEYT